MRRLAGLQAKEASFTFLHRDWSLTGDGATDRFLGLSVLLPSPNGRRALALGHRRSHTQGRRRSVGPDGRPPVVLPVESLLEIYQLESDPSQGRDETPAYIHLFSLSSPVT
jgi:hypothetical protein